MRRCWGDTGLKDVEGTMGVAYIVVKRWRDERCLQGGWI